LQPVVTRESVLSESAASQIIERQRRKDAGDRREQFEAEFGIDGKRRTGVLGSVQLAKYTLDDMSFTVDDFTRSLSDALKLEYDHGRVHRAAFLDDNARPTLPGSWNDMPRGVRFGPELNLEGGKPYVGLVVVVPLGD
jgi:restriction endonuclease Mrr